jgi:hypothetical protein
MLAQIEREAKREREREERERGGGEGNAAEIVAAASMKVQILTQKLVQVTTRYDLVSNIAHEGLVTKATGTNEVTVLFSLSLSLSLLSFIFFFFSLTDGDQRGQGHLTNLAH